MIYQIQTNWLFSIFCLCLFVINLRAQSTDVKVKTNVGTMVLRLYDDTPLHRDNFIKLAESHFYDSLLFHRVIKEFVIQAGDPTSKDASDTTLLGEGDLDYQIPAEIFPNHFHHKGALGMARDNNPEKASSACQFYIVQGKIADDSTFVKAFKRSNGHVIPEEQRKIYRSVGGIPHLDGMYTVFGELISGFPVVDKIARLETDGNSRPKTPVRIISTEVIRK